MGNRLGLSDFWVNFLGRSSGWYSKTILFFLLLNPLLLFLAGPFLTGWAVLIEFIFTLSMALKCYPLQPGGLLAIEAVLMGLTSPETVYKEVQMNFPVILLLIFMVAGIYFMKDFLLYIFTSMITKVKNKIALSLLFCFMGAFLSAFLDALTVTAVVITVASGLYNVYHKYVSLEGESTEHRPAKELEKELEDFRGFLRDLLMHAAIGTVLGGVCTLVGEPQNLLIGSIMGWDFMTFFKEMTHVTIPVFFVGHIVCFLVERFKLFGYGVLLPGNIRSLLVSYVKAESENRTASMKAKIVVQAIGAVYIIFALAFHLAEVGLIGLSVIVFLTAFNGVVEEHNIGRAFEESLPFTALLVVFFTVVGAIHDQHLFKPITDFTLSFEGTARLGAFYISSGILSAISDNVFVATIYISEAQSAYNANLFDKTTYDAIAVAINTGTNIPSIATPNGQAAFLFLLTSYVASLVRLSYLKMVYMALPYTLVLAILGFLLNIIE